MKLIQYAFTDVFTHVNNTDVLTHIHLYYTNINKQEFAFIKLNSYFCNCVNAQIPNVNEGQNL